MSQIGLSIREKIENASIQERIEMLDSMYNKWVINLSEKNKIINKEEPEIFSYLKRALKNFDLDPSNLQIGSFEKQKIICTAELAYLRMYFELQDQGSMDSEQRESIKVKFNKTYRALVDAENAIRSSLHLQGSMSETEIGLGSELDITRYQPADMSTNTAWQNLLLFLLEHLFKRNLRRYNGTCYEKVFTPKGHDTHSWKLKCSLEEFIHNVVRKETHYEMWQNLTNSKDNIKGSVNYLKGYEGPEFEDIVKNRHVFAFNNGLYITCLENVNINNVLKICNDSLKNSDSNSDSNSDNLKNNLNSDDEDDIKVYKDEWIPYGSKKIGSNIVACKYFQIDFDESTISRPNDPTYRYNDPFNIIIDKCKNFAGIMTYQEWPEEAQRWLCILMGRMLYELNEKDGWQIAPYLLGQAGTGKSTILINIIKKFFEDVDTGILSNNVEKKFGLSAFHDKFIFIAPEIKENFSLEQAEFQSLISGEGMSVAVKNEIAFTVNWKVPGAFAGNEVPGFSDNSGSISRRLFVFLFNNKVKKGDTRLGLKLEKEIGYIIHACNRLYLEALEKYGSEDVWYVCPQYFKDSRDEMAENTNALNSCLKSGKFNFGPELYCPESVVLDIFRIHCIDNNLGKPKWSSQYYKGSCANFNITVKKIGFGDKRVDYHGNQKGGLIWFGLDVKPNSEITYNDETHSSDMETIDI